MISIPRSVKISLILGGLFILSACGFQPLYSDNMGASLTELSQISVAPIQRPRPLNIIVERELKARFDPNSQHEQAKYDLAISLTEQRRALGIQIDSSVTRFNLILSGRFNLVDLGTRRTVYSGRLQTVASYNVVSSQFATLAAEREAREKAAQQLTDEVIYQLGLHFANEARQATVASNALSNDGR